MWAFFRDTFGRPNRQRSDERPQMTPSYTIRIRNSTELGADLAVQFNPAVLDGCPYLKANLTDGCTITNVEHIVFKSLMDFLSGRHDLSELLHSRSILLNFAQAWVLGRAIGLPEFQNALIKAFRVRYVELLRNGIYITPLVEPINFLRDTVGYHSVAEKFIIDFHAGLLHSSGDPNSAVHTLPEDIAKHVLDRLHLIAHSRAKNDRILNDLATFAVPSISRGARNQGWSLKIVPRSANSADRMIPRSSRPRPRLRSTESAQVLTASNKSSPFNETAPYTANLGQTARRGRRPTLRTTQSAMQLQSNMHQANGLKGLSNATEICYFPAFSQIIVKSHKGRVHQNEKRGSK